MSDGSPRISDQLLDARRVAFVKARWPGDIVDRCQAGFERELARVAAAGETPAWDVAVFAAPGAVEIPLLERSEAHTPELQTIMRISDAVPCLTTPEIKTTISE